MLTTSPTLYHQDKPQFDTDVNRKDKGDDTPSDFHSEVLGAVKSAGDQAKTLVLSKSFDQSASRVRLKQSYNYILLLNYSRQMAHNLI